MKSWKNDRGRRLQRPIRFGTPYICNCMDSPDPLDGLQCVAFGARKVKPKKPVVKLAAFVLILLSLKLYAIPTFTTIGDTLMSVDMHGESDATVPDGVTCIMDYSFLDCITLTRLTIPASVTGIGGVAFIGCSNLVSITLVGDRPFVSPGAFDDVSDKCIVRLPRDNTTYWNYVRDGRWQGMTVEYYDPDEDPDPGEDTDPVVWTIVNGELIDVELNGETAVTVPSSVTKIRSGAFSGCSSLSILTIPASVTSIDVGAFAECPGLTSVVVDEKNPVYKLQDGFLMSKDCRTLFMRVLGNAAIPSGVTAIGNQAFRNCSDMASVTIPEGVVSIGHQAFYGCSGLARVSIPGSVTSVGLLAFSLCSRELYDTKTVPGVKLVDGWAVGSYGAPPDTLDLSGTRGIGEEAFRQCAELKSVLIPGSVKNIGKSAFSGCANLGSVLVGDGVASIGDDAFSDCSSLTSVTISDSVASIGSWSFWGDTILTTVTIPNSVATIGSWAFGRCSSLSVVFLPSRLGDDVKRDDQFVGCSSDLQLVFYDDADWITVGFDANGGVVEASVTNTHKKCVRGYAIGNLPVPANSLFLGWFTDANEGQPVTEETIVNGSATLYAHWTPPCILIYAIVDSSSQGILSMVSADATNTMSVFAVPQSSSGMFVTNITFLVKEGFEIDRLTTNGVSVAEASGKRGVWTLDLALKDVQNLMVFASAQLIGSDKIPEIDPCAPPEDVAAALAGVTDDGLMANVTNAAQYAAYRTWALALTNEIVSAKMVKTSSNAWLSYALGADALIDREIVSADVRIESFEPSTADGKFEFVVGVDGVNIGGGSVEEETLTSNLKRVFGLEGGAILSELSSANVDITFHVPENGKVKFTAGPNGGDADAKTFFMKVKMSP